MSIEETFDLREPKKNTRVENLNHACLEREGSHEYARITKSRLAEMIFISPTTLVVEINFHLPN